jgi:arsenical pump membrane protein
MTLVDAAVSTYGIAALATGGVVLRPWRLPEATWALAGAALLVWLGLYPWHAALGAVAKGTDVYLFLAGTMIAAELAREEGVFDWLAGHAARAADGDARRPFGLVYLVGTVVTVLLSATTPRRWC